MTAATLPMATSKRQLGKVWKLNGRRAYGGIGAYLASTNPQIAEMARNWSTLDET